MAARSDALVFFGATGDLAFKQIFPALQAMARTGQLDMPVIGIAKQGEGYTVDNLRERARQSVEQHGSFDADAIRQIERAAGLRRRRLPRPDHLPEAGVGARRGTASAPLPGHPAQPVRRSW